MRPRHRHLPGNTGLHICGKHGPHGRDHIHICGKHDPEGCVSYRSHWKGHMVTPGLKKGHPVMGHPLMGHASPKSLTEVT